MSGIAGTPTLAALQNPTSQTGGYVEPHVSSSNPIPTSSVSPVGTTGAPTTTATTTGFAAGVDPSHTSGSIPPQTQTQNVTGGGLATSPIVQSLSSGHGHSAGLTSPSPTPASSLTGREQAEAQLRTVGVHSAIVGGETPGLEVPGGFGVTNPSHPQTSIYQDVTEALHEVGTAAFSVLPRGLVEKVSGSPTRTTTTTTTTTTQTTAASPILPSAESVSNTIGNLFNQVKHVVAEIKDDIKSELHAAPTVSSGVDRSRVDATGWDAQTGKVTPTTSGDGRPITAQMGDLVEQARQLAMSGVQNLSAAASSGAESVAGAAKSAGDSAASVVNPLIGSASTSTSHAVAPATSLPTDEFAGARAGEHSDGVGALPGRVNETGVAVLPDEKKEGGVIGSGSDSLAAKPKGFGQVDVNDPSAKDALPAAPVASDKTSKLGDSVPSAPVSFAATPSSNLNPSTTTTTTNSSNLDHLGLAPPLGAFVGTTPIPNPDTSRAGGIPDGVGIATAGPPAAVLAVKELSGQDKPANNRTDSLASTTAVLHGTPGDRSSDKVTPPAELNTLPEKEKAVVPPAAFNSLETDHKVPGSEEGAVGHRSEAAAPAAPATPAAAPEAAAASPATPAPAAASTPSDPSAHHLTSNDGEQHSVYKNAIAAEPKFDHHILTEENDPAVKAATAPGVTAGPAGTTTSHDSSATDSPTKKGGFLSKIKSKLHHEK